MKAEIILTKSEERAHVNIKAPFNSFGGRYQRLERILARRGLDIDDYLNKYPSMLKVLADHKLFKTWIRKKMIYVTRDNPMGKFIERSPSKIDRNI